MKDIVIDISEVSKRYEVYSNSKDRLKQMLFRGRRKYYKEFWALRNINLQVSKGETVGIVGVNGSGKSTLLQIIAGTLTQTTGTVSVNGRVAALLELGSGFNPDFTGRENVYLNGAILGINRSEMEVLFSDITDFAGIGDFIDQPISSYSSGMVVRLAFAVQVMIPKDILIVDEALAVGDELFQRKCYSKIDEFKHSGGTILFVSHSGSTVIELCDRAVLLDNGEHIITGSSKSVINLYHKFLYTVPERKERIRSEIKEQMIELEAEMVNTHQQNDIEMKGYVGQSATPDYSTLKSYFDPDLLTHLNSVEYDSDGTHIFSPGITDEYGESANILLAGHRYYFQYKVKFSKSHRNVRFGFLIKTPTGFGLGGGVSARQRHGLKIVPENVELVVKFSFVPKLNAGIYFLNGGVLAETNQGEVFIHRVIDLCTFKIVPENEVLFTDHVDFDIRCDVIEE
jgi:lipopolysaccharide transport system ATP-binding protein